MADPFLRGGVNMSLLEAFFWALIIVLGVILLGFILKYRDISDDADCGDWGDFGGY